MHGVIPPLPHMALRNRAYLITGTTSPYLVGVVSKGVNAVCLVPERTILTELFDGS